MKWIERYIYDVKRRLPETIKNDVEAELTSQINDMLGADNSEENIKNVLSKLGSPKMLANEYRGKERYLISPTYFEQFIEVLKVVLIITSIIGFISGSLEVITNITNQIWIVIFIKILFTGTFTAISTAFAGFGIVTIIFSLLDYKEIKLSSKPWMVEELPKLPKETDIKISRRKVSINLTITTVLGATFALLLSRYQEVFGWYDNGVLVVLFFNPQTVKTFVPFIIGLVVLNIIVHGIILYKNYWKTNTTILYSFYQVVALLIGLFLIWHPQLISDNFVDYILSVSSSNIDSIMLGINVSRGIISIVLIIITMIDTLALWYKLHKLGGLKKQ